MKIIVNLSDEEVKTIKDHLVFRMGWIQAGMDKKEPLDLVLNKVLIAAEIAAEQKAKEMK